ncbi:cyclase [Kitasatospora sp. MAA4]|uniref:MBL fold metallo-hydrolase n=1 Tax=Kitasatospora sp. MAA4 TaxID=3035093 RepID=UPI002474FAA8|nr:MBL fold metallo-hydrolase [Kitasatospora sp. MAA4]MDH6132395.1 cyclase [Kitasatospora sp. MAA4]
MDAVTEELAPGVYAYVQPHGGWCVNNAGIVVGRNAVVVVDTAATEARARALLATVGRLAPGRRRLVVSTHHHGDHTFGNSLFAPRALLISHRRGPQEVARRGLALQQLWPEVEWGSLRPVLPTVTVHEGMTLDLGGTTVELLHLGPAHTCDDLVAWLPRERVLFAGDIVFSGCTPFVLMGSLQGSLDVIRRLRELAPRVVVSGHGAVGGPEVLDATEAYLRWVRQIAQAGLRDGLEPLEAARRADLGRFAQLLDAERLVGNLHRAYLESRGEPLGAHIGSTAVMREMVAFNGGRPLSCAA